MDDQKSEKYTSETAQTIKQCIPVRTKVIGPHDSLLDEVLEHVASQLIPGDIIVLSEKAVAFSQGVVIDARELRVGPLARFLSRYVTRSPYGIGLRDPRSMQVAINMAGAARILLASAVGAVTKLFGSSGYFYRVAGLEVSMIDGAVDHRFAELRHYIVPAPREPDCYASQVSAALEGFPVVIMDINDIGRSLVVGSSGGELPVAEIEDFMRYDNPLGQGRQQTPVGILRRQEQAQS